MDRRSNPSRRRALRNVVLLGVALAIAACACVAPAPAPEPVRVLFVGNSQVYTSNLPAVLDALGAANGRRVHSEMLVQGGATFAQRVADGAVAAVLERQRFDHVVLQERGGDLLCFEPGPCDKYRASAQALQVLAATVRSHGAQPLLLGTYQPLARVSRALVDDEARAAADARMPYIAVSEAYRRGTLAHPELPWHDPDGMHPGRQLALLNAVQLHCALFGECPDAAAFTVTAPLHTPRTKFFPPLLASEKVLAVGDPAARHEYPAEAVAIALALAGAAPR